MNGNRLTGAAERAAQRYKFLLASFANLYTQAIGAAHPGADVTISRVIGQAIESAGTYLTNERSVIAQEIETERLDALFETRDDMGIANADDGVALDNTQGHAQDLDTALRVQIERDIASLVGGLRQAALRARLIGKSRGISERAALVQIRDENTQPSFTFQDRASKKWPSEKIVRTLVRKTLVMVWNETAMLEMADRGYTHAIIDHPDENHSERGSVLSLTEEPMAETLTWPQVRDDVFHPNTQAYLRPFAST